MTAMVNQCDLYAVRLHGQPRHALYCTFRSTRVLYRHEVSIILCLISVVYGRST